MHLSSVIIQREVASVHQVEEALARQVLYGGDLVTNLLEVSDTSEPFLMPVVGEVFGISPWPSGELPTANPETIKLISPEIASAREFFPLSVDSLGLVIAVAEPLPGDVKNELEFMLATPVHQRLVPLVRIRQALARDFGIPLGERFQRLLSRLSGVSGAPLSGETTPTASAASAASAIAPSTAAPITKLPPRPPSHPPVALVLEKVGSYPPPPMAAGAPRTLVRNADAPDAPPPRPPRRRRGPLTFDMATAEMEQAAERDAIFDLIFDFARQFFDYTVLFVVRGDIAEGRDAFGNGASRERVAQISVPLDMPSILKMARDQRTVVVKVPASAGLDAVLANDLGRPGTAACVVIPVVVRTRIVALILGDGDNNDVEATSLSETKKLVDKAASEFERLVARRKIENRVQPPVVVPTTESEADAPVAPASPSLEELAAPIRELVGDPNLDRIDTNETIDTAENVTTHRRRSEAPALEFSTNLPYPLGFGGDIGEVVSASDRAPADALADNDPDRTPIAPAVDPDATPLAPPVAVATVVGDASITVSAPSTAEATSKDTRHDQGRPTPSSDHQISVAAHKPPSPHSEETPLASVIVDMASEYIACVDRVIAGHDDEAEIALIAGGAYAMPFIMAKFPGPVTLDLEHLPDGPWPRVDECGPVLRLVANQQLAALPFLLSRIEDPAIENRFWATFLLTEIISPEAVEPALARVFDDDVRVRRVAREAARVLSESHPIAVVESLEAVATNRGTPLLRRVWAIEALGATREALAGGALIPLVCDDVREIATQAHKALVLVTRQDFAGDRAAWQAWWNQNKERDRVEWLIDALMHEQAEIRAASDDELKTITKEHVGHYDDTSKRERERAQARYREWWWTIGRMRRPH
ncbi:MAG: hypothetical protein FWD73_08840 [Polyangiaceae bacterium]|nr:hypothetical protein [Polyangiaceae bacterium]